MEGKITKKYNKGGRKRELNPAVFRYSIRLNLVENAKFTAMFLESGMKNKSKFIRCLIFGKQMKVVKIDKAAHDYFIRLTHFYSQYQMIGNNYNQTVKALKTNFSEKRALGLLYKLEKDTIELVRIMQQVKELTKEFEEKHLNH